jgi:hypothetical protein
VSSTERVCEQPFCKIRTAAAAHTMQVLSCDVAALQTYCSARERCMVQIIGGHNSAAQISLFGGQMRRPWPMPVAGMQKLWSALAESSTACCFLSRSMWEPPWAGENRTSAGRRDPPGSIASFIEILVHSLASTAFFPSFRDPYLDGPFGADFLTGAFDWPL